MLGGSCHRSRFRSSSRPSPAGLHINGRQRQIHHIIAHCTSKRARETGGGRVSGPAMLPRAGWVSMLLLEWLRKQCNHPALQSATGHEVGDGDVASERSENGAAEVHPRIPRHAVRCSWLNKRPVRGSSRQKPEVAARRRGASYLLVPSPPPPARHRSERAGCWCRLSCRPSAGSGGSGPAGMPRRSGRRARARRPVPSPRAAPSQRRRCEVIWLVSAIGYLCGMSDRWHLAHGGCRTTSLFSRKCTPSKATNGCSGQGL